MRQRSLIAVSVLMTAAVALAAAQERVRPKGPASFATSHEELAKAWEDGRYGRCTSLSRDLLAMISARRRDAILASLPDAPRGFEVVPQARSGQPESPLVAAMSGGVGNAVEKRYAESNGSGDIHVAVTADTPLVKMFSMWVSAPELLGEGAEAIEYGEIDAVLKKEGPAWTLQILIDESLVEVRVRGRDDAFLLRMFNQNAVDHIAATLRR